jgi:DNA primase
MSDHLKHRIAAVKEAVSILEILEAYGYRVRSDAGHREQQFQCDLHGDGRDTKPSARVYPESNTWYCFACVKGRDVIETVQEKERKTFIEALTLLERKYHIKVPIQEDWNPTTTPVEKKVSPYEQERQRLMSLLKGITEDRILKMEASFLLWEEVDRIHFLLHEQEFTPEAAAERLAGLRLKVMNKVGWVASE